jgi:hypothetical protein
MGEAKRKHKNKPTTEPNAYVLGVHDEILRAGMITARPDVDHYLVQFEELACSVCGGYGKPATQVVVAIADMIGKDPPCWFFFDSREQRDAFLEAYKRREKGTAV